MQSRNKASIYDKVVIDGSNSPGFAAWYRIDTPTAIVLTANRVSNNQTTDAPLYQKFYFFNLTNANAVLAGAFVKLRGH